MKIAVDEVWARVEARDELRRTNDSLVLIEAPRLTREMNALRVKIDRIYPGRPGSGFGESVTELDITSDTDGVALCFDLAKSGGRHVRVALRDFAPERGLFTRETAIAIADSAAR